MNIDPRSVLNCVYWASWNPAMSYFYPRWNYQPFPVFHRDESSDIIRCEEINNLPGFEDFEYPSSSYATTMFGEYSLWAPPSQAELDFWKNLRVIRKKLTLNYKKSQLGGHGEKEWARSLASLEDASLKKDGDEPKRDEEVSKQLEGEVKILRRIHKKKRSETKVADEAHPSSKVVGQEFKRLVLQRAEEENFGAYMKAQRSASTNFIQGSSALGEKIAASSAIRTSKSAESCGYPTGSRLYKYVPQTVTETLIAHGETNKPQADFDYENISQAAITNKQFASARSSISDNSVEPASAQCAQTLKVPRTSLNSFPPVYYNKAVGLQCVDDAISQDAEVQELLNAERSVLSRSAEKRREKDCKEKKKPVIELRDGDSWIGPDGKPKDFLCVFCKGNNEPEEIYTNHPIRANGIVVCPFLRQHTCVICKETGHTIKYCKSNRRGFFAMKSIGKADLFLTAEKDKLAEATTTALFEATTSGLLSHIESLKEKNELARKKHSRVPLATINGNGNQPINRGNPKDSIESEYTPIGRYDVKKLPISPLQHLSSNGRLRVKKST